VTQGHHAAEPDVLEHKFYAAGVGLILALGLSGGGGREELIRYESGRYPGPRARMIDSLSSAWRSGVRSSMVKNRRTSAAASAER